MDRIAQLLTKRARSLQRNLESLLDLDQWSPPKPVQKFEIKTDLSALRNPALKTQLISKTSDELFVSLLSQLTPYFEAGLLIYRKSKNAHPQGVKEVWTHGAAFYEGSYFHLPDQISRLTIELPILQKLELKKCAPYQVLAPLGIPELCDHSDANAFMLRIHEQFALVLLTQLPEPWLRMHMEKIYDFISWALAQHERK